MTPEKACPSCGVIIRSTALNCPSCGERIHVLRTKSFEPEHLENRKSSLGTKMAGAGGLLYLLWKFKVVILLVLSKAKFILLGLGQASTAISMVLSAWAWAYNSGQGWPFGIGLVLSIYLHEMGHVHALSRYGIKASAPLFVPFVGAFIRLKQNFDNPAQNARVGLAGPLWGLGAALACEGMGYAFSWPLGFGLARLGAVINLFNLIPVWQLDGGRAMGALNKTQRWTLVLVIALAHLWTREGLLLLLAAGCLYKALRGEAPKEPDHGVLALYILLVAALSYLSQMNLGAIPLRRSLAV